MLKEEEGGKKYKQTNSAKKLKNYLSMVPKGLNAYKLNPIIMKLN